VTHAELRELFEAQAVAAQATRGTLAEARATIFMRLAATTCNVPYGRLSELGNLMRLAPVGFSRAMDEIGTTFTPRHAIEFVAGMVGRLRPEEKGSKLYAPKAYREILRR
jgi:hypothetical protein